MIGQFRVKISALCVNKGVDDWWHLNYKDKSVGQIHLSSNWKPHDDGSEAAKAAAAEKPFVAPAPQIHPQATMQAQPPQVQQMMQQPVHQQPMMYQQP